MSTPVTTPITTVAPKTGPFYFGPESRRLFGWLHGATSGRNRGDVGVVLCNPFGFDTLSTHRATRHFAEDFAAAGFPTLRFDYDGTGDSVGTDRDPERVRAWLDSIHRAVETLKDRTGVQRVCLFGIRLGATLAAAAATERAEKGDCAALIAIAPVLSPERYLRELATFQAWGKFSKSPDESTGLEPGEQEAGGFIITPSTAAALVELDLLKSTTAPAPRVLVLEKDARTSSEAWTARLVAQGAAADRRFVDGFAKMSCDPHETVMPTAMIEAAVEWLAACTDAAGTKSSAPRAFFESPVCLEAAIDARIVERPVFTDTARSRFGVLTRSRDLVHSGRAFIILNAGSQHRIGPNRLWVTFAREWARQGALVLRLDLSGLGDSRPRSGERENYVYSPAGTADIAEAIDYLKRQWGATTFDVIGLCGSAYHGLKAAAQGVPVTSVLAINQQAFFWDTSLPGNVLPANFTASSEVSRYSGALKSRKAWKKILSGKIHFRTVFRLLLRRLADVVAGKGRTVARTLQLPLKDDLAAELRTVARANIPLRFMFSDGEGGLKLLYELGGATARRLELKGAFSVERVPGTNHTFTATWTHALLKRRIDAWLNLTDDAADPMALSSRRLPDQASQKPWHRQIDNPVTILS